MSALRVIVVFLFLVLASSVWAEVPYVPGSDTALYKQIYDAVRHVRHPDFASQRHAPGTVPPPLKWTDEPYAQLFNVRLLVQGEWAVFDACLAPHKDGVISATVHKIDGKWTPVWWTWHDDLTIGRSFRGEVDQPEPNAKGVPEELIKAWDIRFN